MPATSAQTSSKNLRMRPSTIFSMMFSGLPDSRACSMKTLRSRSATAASTSSTCQRQRIGRGDMHGDLTADRASASVAGRFRRRRARRACQDRRQRRCGHRLRPRPCRPRAWPSGAGSCSRRYGRRVLDRYRRPICRSGIGCGADGFDRTVGAQRHGDRAGQILESIVAGDEVGLGVDFDHNGRIAVGRDADQAFGGGAAGLLVSLGNALGLRSQSTAASMSPPVSASAASCSPSCRRRSCRAVLSPLQR
jgi:hypothetical protein